MASGFPDLGSLQSALNRAQGIETSRSNDYDAAVRKQQDASETYHNFCSKYDSVKAECDGLDSIQLGMNNARSAKEKEAASLESQANSMEDGAEKTELKSKAQKAAEEAAKLREEAMKFYDEVYEPKMKELEDLQKQKESSFSVMTDDRAVYDAYNKKEQATFDVGVAQRNIDDYNKKKAEEEEAAKKQYSNNAAGAVQKGIDTIYGDAPRKASHEKISDSVDTLREKGITKQNIGKNGSRYYKPEQKTSSHEFDLGGLSAATRWNKSEINKYGK